MRIAYCHSIEHVEQLFYKNCWINISDNGVIHQNENTTKFLELNIRIELLSIQSSDIAFTIEILGLSFLFSKVIFTQIFHYPLPLQNLILSQIYL